MSKLSEKEKQMFLAIGLSENLINFVNERQITITALYSRAIKHCFIHRVPESWATESLRRCYDACTSGNSYRLQPEFEALIRPTVISDEEPKKKHFLEIAANLRKEKEKAQEEALIRDSVKGYGILQMSARRYAVIIRHSHAWSLINKEGEMTLPDDWMVRFDYVYAKDYEGNELKNLVWTDARQWYQRFVSKTEPE